jgi:uncharacterized protein (TIGR03382 family)
VALLVGSVLWLVVLGFFGSELATVSLAQISIMTVISSICLGVLIYRADRRGPWAFPFLYFLILFVFHGGLYLASALLGGPPASSTRLQLLWFVAEPSVRAAYLVNVALVCYALGYAISRFVPGVRGSGRQQDDAARVFDDRSRNGIVAVGCAVTILSTLVWFVVSIDRVGPTFFLGSYLGYLRDTSGSALPWAYAGISLGVTLCALDPRNRLGRIGFGAFALFGVPAFVLGLRGEVLFPLVAVIGVMGCGRRLWRARGFWLGCVVVLLSISFVSEARIDGLAALGRSSVALSPIRAVEEMGFSVRPVVTSVSWHEYSSEPFLRGATYVAPFDRQARRLLGLPVPDASNDHRLMNVEISDRVGPIGGSVIAEAHHNAGTPGVAVVLSLVGLLTGWLFRRRRSAVSLALSGVLAVLLLMHIRNSFAPIPAWGALGCGLILLGVLVGKIPRRAERQPRAVRHAPKSL